MLKSFRVWLYERVLDLEETLYPYGDEQDYYIKVKNDETGEQHMMIDWIKSHNEKIDRLQEEMFYVRDKLRQLENGQK